MLNPDNPLDDSCFVGARFIGRSRTIAQQVALLQRRFSSNGLSGLKGNLILVLCLLGLTPLAQAKDLSALQTAARIAQDDARNAKEERDADAQLVSAAEMELEQQKKRLEAARKKASQSDIRYLDSKKKYDKAQTDLDRAWKQ